MLFTFWITFTERKLDATSTRRVLVAAVVNFPANIAELTCLTLSISNINENFLSLYLVAKIGLLRESNYLYPLTVQKLSSSSSYFFHR